MIPADLHLTSREMTLLRRVIRERECTTTDVATVNALIRHGMCWSEVWVGPDPNGRILHLTRDGRQWVAQHWQATRHSNDDPRPSRPSRPDHPQRGETV